MERRDNDAQHEHNRDLSKKLDLEPGMEERNLLSDTRDEAPIDKDPDNTATVASDAGDETYEDEDMNDPDYFEKRAGDNVRR